MNLLKKYWSYIAILVLLAVIVIQCQSNRPDPNATKKANELTKRADSLQTVADSLKDLSKAIDDKTSQSFQTEKKAAEKRIEYVNKPKPVEPTPEIKMQLDYLVNYKFD